MLEVIRTRGLILFLVAFATVSLVQGLMQTRASNLAIASLLLAVAVEEAQRREILPRVVWAEALRWSCVIGALGFLLQGF